MTQALVLADWHTPLHPLLGPVADRVEAELGGSNAGVGDGETTVVEGRERDLQTTPFLADEVADRHLHVGEGNDRIREGLEPHEATAVLDLDAVPVRLDDEG